MIDRNIVLRACGGRRLVQVFIRIKSWTIGGLWWSRRNVLSITRSGHIIRRIALHIIRGCW